MKKRRLALVLGSGFSRASELPTTEDLNESLLSVTAVPALGWEFAVEEEISKIIREFWSSVFGWTEKQPKPTLEDHFTLIDLAANSGHQLGRCYGPRQLRAIRRMTIHRIFKILDSSFRRKPFVDQLFESLVHDYDLSIITLNWDIVAELYASSHGGFCNGCGERDLDGDPVPEHGIVILKLHGSSSAIYCNCCRSMITVSDTDGDIYKAALRMKLYLEPTDFELFQSPPGVVNSLREFALRNRQCVICGSTLAGRIATFSYRKDLSVPHFQASWDRAGMVLREAERWLFIGYSMPEADFEFRHLLKTAQLACTMPDRDIEAIVLENDCGSDHSAARRYDRFFGSAKRRVFPYGLENWMSDGGFTRWMVKE